MRKTRMVDYLDRLKAMYPDVREEELKIILKEGFKRIKELILEGKDVCLRDAARGKENMLFYKPATKVKLKSALFQRAVRRKKERNLIENGNQSK